MWDKTKTRKFLLNYKGTVCLFAIFIVALFRYFALLLQMRPIFQFIIEGHIRLTRFGTWIFGPSYLIVRWWYVTMPLFLVALALYSRHHVISLLGVLQLKEKSLRYRFAFAPVLVALLVVTLFSTSIQTTLFALNAALEETDRKMLGMILPEVINKMESHSGPHKPDSWFF